MLGFSNPGWFALFLMAPVLFWARYLWRQRGGRLVFPFLVWGGEEFQPRDIWLKAFISSSRILSWLGLSMLIIALAGPEIVEQEELHLSRGIDIMIVLDQSLSMGVQDYPPVNRFDLARQVIHRFVQDRKGDSIGLVSFGSQAVLRCPPTDDYDWLLQRLEELRIRELGDDTAIGMGLAVATLHLTDSMAAGKVILLLTDGDDNAGEVRLETAMQLATDHGIRVYLIKVGKQGEFPIHLTDPETGVTTSGTVITHFDEGRSRTLTESYGGRFWEATSPGTLEAVFRTVNSLEKVERQVSVQIRSRPLHRPAVIIGVLILMFVYVVRRLLMEEIP